MPRFRLVIEYDHNVDETSGTKWIDEFKNRNNSIIHIWMDFFFIQFYLLFPDFSSFPIYLRLCAMLFIRLDCMSFQAAKNRDTSEFTANASTSHSMFNQTKLHYIAIRYIAVCLTYIFSSISHPQSVFSRLFLLCFCVIIYETIMQL